MIAMTMRVSMDATEFVGWLFLAFLAGFIIAGLPVLAAYYRKHYPRDRAVI